MRIFLILEDAPRPDGEAVEVVSYEVACHAARIGHKVIIQLILRYLPGSESSARALQGLERIEIENVVVNSPLYIPGIADGVTQVRAGPIRRCMKIVESFKTSELFPAVCLESEVATRVRESQADVILGVWSWEALAATYRIHEVPKFMYYGNPDHLPMEARLRNSEIFGIPSSTLRDKVGLALARLRNRRRRHLHIKMMNQCEIAANNSILDARFYTEQGHPRSIYLQNMWPEIPDDGTGGKSVETGRNGVIRIIASVGNLGATGNTFGLQYLGKELVPRLGRRLPGQRVELHVVGKGSATPAVAQYLDDPRIILRGWVDDINHEIRSSHAFLVLTNVNEDFLVGNTRILLAWALRSCVIMHTNSGLAMPEIKHGENALLGQTPDEIADLIVQVVGDDGMRQKIGEGGHETFRTYYRSDVVVPRMLALLQEMVTA